MNKIGKIFIFMFIFVLITASLTPISSGFPSNVKLNKIKEQNDDIWWYKYQHDQQNTGCSSSTAPETNTVLWKCTPTLGFMFAESSPAIVNGKVYVGAGSIIGSGKLFCLDEFDGSVIWAYPTDGWIMSSPNYYEGKIYFGSFYDGKVHCINAESGDFIWKYQTDQQVFSSPAINNNKVFIGSWNFDSGLGKMFCLDASNGDLIWDYEPNMGVYSSPAILNNNVYVGSMDGYIYCFDEINGNVLWKNKIGNKIRSSPAIFNDNIYVGSDNGNIYCLNSMNGSIIWNYKTGDYVVSSPAFSNGKLYIGSYDRKIYCLDAFTGVHLWNYSNGQKVYNSPAVADNKVYIGTGSNSPPSGEFLCLNAQTGVLIWSFSTGNPAYSSPAVARNKTYMGSNDGTLFCFCDNIAPNEPNKPQGPISGIINKIYEYKTKTIDLNGDYVRYGWDWDGDKEVDEWTEFYPSATFVTVTHCWQNKGIYFVRVIAEDTEGFKSTWSAPLPIIIPAKKTVYYKLFDILPALIKKLI